MGVLAALAGCQVVFSASATRHHVLARRPRYPCRTSLYVHDYVRMYVCACVCVRACVFVRAPWCFAGPLRRSLSPVVLGVRRQCSFMFARAWAGMADAGPPLPHSSLMRSRCCGFAGGFSCRPYRRCNPPHSRVCRCADGVPCSTGFALEIPRPGMDQQFGRALTTSAPPPHMSAPHGFVPESRYPTGPVRCASLQRRDWSGTAEQVLPHESFPGILRARPCGRFM